MGLPFLVYKSDKYSKVSQFQKMSYFTYFQRLSIHSLIKGLFQLILKIFFNCIQQQNHAFSQTGAIII